MLNALIVVYRESFEALLVVGLLYSFLARRHAGAAAFRALALGTLLGLGLSAALAFAIHAAESEMQGLALEVFQLTILVIAVGLMTQMCIWMRRNARHMKKDLEAEAGQALGRGNFWSLVVICMIAVGREGSECAIFLYGLFIEAMQKSQLASFAGMSALGLLLGLITWFAFQKGFQAFSQKTYFTVSSLLLFVTAGGLLLTITRKLIELDWMPVGQKPLWDSAWLIDERSSLGQILSIIAGYHTRPAAASVVAYGAYWAVSLWLFVRAGRPTKPLPQTVASATFS